MISPIRTLTFIAASVSLFGCIDSTDLSTAEVEAMELEVQQHEATSACDDVSAAPVIEPDHDATARLGGCYGGEWVCMGWDTCGWAGTSQCCTGGYRCTTAPEGPVYN